jgi:hypothetical protein
MLKRTLEGVNECHQSLGATRAPFEDVPELAEASRRVPSPLPEEDQPRKRLRRQLS